MTTPFMGKHPIFSAWHSEWEASLSGVNAQRNFLACQYMCRSYPCKTWRKQANCPTSALNSKPFAVPVSKTAKLLDFCLDGTWWTFRDTSCNPPNMSPNQLLCHQSCVVHSISHPYFEMWKSQILGDPNTWQIRGLSENGDTKNTPCFWTKPNNDFMSQLKYWLHRCLSQVPSLQPIYPLNPLAIKHG